MVGVQEGFLPGPGLKQSCVISSLDGTMRIYHLAGLNFPSLMLMSEPRDLNMQGKCHTNGLHTQPVQLFYFVWRQRLYIAMAVLELTV